MSEERLLISLDEFNAARTVPPSTLTGIACPECGKELYDANPGTYLMSNPPKVEVKCAACGYKGYRLA